ncbi:FxsA family protein [Bacillus sp. B15-48]|uniref:FxsA family protein n=1 Tax=Bacillus sp. B15-48 TaxID=1548601 RepID=UPI00193FB586|nr:FxsA family protein [Bacillus sp. B15-48]MBM4762535.1 membrane protein FxsA [Bacillus sp. B15-48]
MRYLFLAIIIVPAVEIAILLWFGQLIGVLPTFLFILLTGLIGAYLAKQQGIVTIRKVQDNMERGIMPGDALLDGVCILIGGTLLLTPGFVTDIIGFLLLIPATRKHMKNWLAQFFRKRMDRRTITIIR